METTTSIALSRQMVLRREMDVLANNIANMTATGFRAEALLAEQVPVDVGRHQTVRYVQDVALVRDLTPGAMIPTSNPLDLAIEGEAYFVIATDQGERYTRNGQFRLSAIGEIVTASGESVLDDGGAPIAVPPGSASVSIAPDGTVSTPDAILGRLGLVTFEDLQDLEKAGHGLYRTDQAPLPAAGVSIIQGMIEGSNVRPVVEMTEMMATVRAYQGTQKIIDAHHELERRMVERMLEVGG
ncbi:MAG: flagellar basal-body rod protein FlgF [Rhizobiales bacterium]|nr:flagellar basal-body rod protein FlgF [Hyphomicrobiales bacterium]